MGVPVNITDLSTTAASNSPAGSDSIGTTLDDYIRSHAAFIAQLFNTAAIYSGTVGGTANAITLTPSPAITAYQTGQRIIFKAASNSTSSVTLAVSGLAAKNVYQADGTTQYGNSDITSGKYYAFIYDSSLNSSAGGFIADGTFLTAALAAATYAPLASPTFTGTPSLPTGTTAVTQAASNNSTKLATTAYVDTAQALDLKTASNLSDLGSLSTALTNLGFSTTLGTSGSVTLPGGVIIKWGSTGTINSLATASPTFGAAFPTAAYTAYVSWTAASSNAMVITALSTTGLTIDNNTNTNQNAYYLAIGH